MKKAKTEKKTLDQRCDEALTDLTNELETAWKEEGRSQRTKDAIGIMLACEPEELTELLTILNGLKKQQALILRLNFRSEQRNFKQEQRLEEQKLRKAYRTSLKELGVKRRKRSKKSEPSWFHPDASEPLKFYSGGSKPKWMREWVEANPDKDWKTWLVKEDPCPNHDSRDAWKKKEETK